MSGSAAAARATLRAARGRRGVITRLGRLAWWCSDEGDGGESMLVWLRVRASAACPPERK